MLYAQMKGQCSLDEFENLPMTNSAKTAKNNGFSNHFFLYRTFELRVLNILYRCVNVPFDGFDRTRAVLVDKIF